MATVFAVAAVRFFREEDACIRTLRFGKLDEKTAGKRREKSEPELPESSVASTESSDDSRASQDTGASASDVSFVAISCPGWTKRSSVAIVTFGPPSEVE